MNWQITLLGASALVVALVSIYLPSVYIRKTRSLYDYNKKIEFWPSLKNENGT